MSLPVVSELIFAKPAKAANVETAMQNAIDREVVRGNGGAPRVGYDSVRDIEVLEIEYQTHQPLQLRFRNQPGLHVHLRRHGTGRYAIDNSTIIDGASTEMQIYCSSAIWYKDVFELDGVSPRNMLFGLTPATATRYLGGIADTIFEQSRKAAYHQRLRIAPEVIGLIDEFFDLDKDGLQGLRRDAKLLDILAESLSSLETPTVTTGSRYRTRPADVARLRGIEQHIVQNLSADLSTERLASLAGMSVSRFKAAFRDMSGLPIGSYVRDKRVEHAAALLRGGVSVGEAAARVGYRHSGHFARVFRETYGSVPHEF